MINRINIKENALTYDDILLEPKNSSIYSRKDISLKTRLVGNIYLNSPLISANMDTVTDHRMAAKMNELGGLGIIHRFFSPNEHLSQFMGLSGPRVLTIGVKLKEELSKIQTAVDYPILLEDQDAILIDVAHGDHSRVIDLIYHIKERWPHLPIIAGNVATYDGTLNLLKAGANAVKIGCGPGSVCKTRTVAGIGVPQLTALMECRTAIEDYNKFKKVAYEDTACLLADGGIRTSGDIVKALCLADTVMIGSLFAGTDESPGLVIDGRKIYRGMASRGAQLSIGVERAPEGVETTIPHKGSVIPIFKELEEGIRSGLSYLGCNSIEELHRTEITMIKITNAGLKESHPHILG